ncbi:LLM class flavin-dependent oxidoreductase [Spirosoma arcticum]
MEVGIDSFAASNFTGKSASPDQNMTAMADILERMKRADEVGLDAFGIGEHHRREFLDSAPITILSAAAALTKTIRLTSAVTVLSAADPVRVFQEFASLDIISRGRAEIVAGRGSFVEAYPLFGLNLHDYDDLFVEKLELLLTIRDQEVVQWKGRFRAALNNVAVYPRPVQSPLPVWVGVGGTPESFVRAGTLGLPLMVAIIGGETRRFRPLVDLYRKAGKQAGFPPEQLKVGLHSMGYVAETSQQARDEFYPGYAESFTKIGRERGYPPVTRPQFDYQTAPEGAFLIGSPQEVAEKIQHHSEALGGIDRVMFQMDTALLPQAKLLKSIELLGQHIAPVLRIVS